MCGFYTMVKKWCAHSESFFLQLEQHCLMHTVSLPACKNHIIHHKMFVVVLNDAENIPASEYIIVVRVQLGIH